MIVHDDQEPTPLTMLIKMLSDTVKLNTLLLYKKILSIEQKPGICHSILIYKLNNEISKSKKRVFAKTCLLS